MKKGATAKRGGGGPRGDMAARLAAWVVLLAICVVFCALRAMPMWVAHGLLLVFLAACLAPTAAVEA